VDASGSKPAAHLAVQVAQYGALATPIRTAEKVRRMPTAVPEVGHQILAELLRHPRFHQSVAVRVLPQDSQVRGVLVKDFLKFIVNISSFKLTKITNSAEKVVKQYSLLFCVLIGRFLNINKSIYKLISVFQAAIIKKFICVALFDKWHNLSEGNANLMSCLITI